MLNRATADLASATVRTRFFGGRRGEDVAAEMPILPVDAPGMPIPGQSLVDFGRTLGDPAPTLRQAAGRKKPKLGRPDGAWLTSLVRSAIYQTGTYVSLQFAQDAESYAFLPGVTTDAAGARYGPSPCRLVVVGKNIGRAEVADQRPFVGPGSDPLWKAWREVGLPQPGPELPTFLTNLIRFDPPAAAITRLPSQWVADGLHLLYQELAACRPEFVLLLGADALKAVFGAKAKISEYKGRTADLTIDCRATEDDPEDKFTCRVVVADHPLTVVRDPDKYPQLLTSMGYLCRQLGFGSSLPAPVATDYQAVYTLDELRRAVAETERESCGGGYVAFDCEWEGSHPTEPGSYLYTVQWSHAPGHARVVYLRRCGGAENTSLPIDRAVPLLRRLFAQAPARGARLVGHFAKADLPWLASVGVDLYSHYVGPADDPDADGSAAKLWGWQKSYFEGAFDTYVAAHGVDECFPADARVITDDGEKTIGEIVNNRLSIRVLSMDLMTRQLVYRRVKRHVKIERHHNMVEVRHERGILRCTSNHPVWTVNRGYVEAGSLADHDQLCVVHGAVSETKIPELLSGSILQQVLCLQVAGDTAGYPSEAVQSGRHSQNYGEDSRQGESVPWLQAWSDATGTSREDDRDQEKERYVKQAASSSGRRWSPERQRGAVGRTPRYGLGSRSICEDRSWRSGPSNTLQTGRLEREVDGRDRVGWREPQLPEGETQRCPEEPILTHSRVVGVSILEQDFRSVSGKGRGCDSFVYCLEVEETHNFFAEGTLVSNCRPLGLEVLTSSELGMERYDIDVVRWVEDYCKANKIRRSKLKGYGNYPEERMTHYACSDADGSGRLYLLYNGDPKKGTRGKLDADRYGNSCRQIFATRMRAWAAVAEMERYGMEADRGQHKTLREAIAARREELVARLREQAAWADFDPARRAHRIEFLFGEQFSDKKDALGNGVSVRPHGSLSLYLTPHKATQTTGGGKLWADALARAERSGVAPSPAADKETLVVLGRMHPLAALLLDIDFLSTAMKIMFRLPTAAEADAEPATEEEQFSAGIHAAEEPPEAPGDEVHESGFLHHVCHDGRVRTRIGHVETGRYSSSKPNMTNCFPPQVEFMTRRGWVKGPELRDGDEVAQFDPATEELSFVVPLRVIRQSFSGELVRVETEEQIGLTMTPDHRCLSRRRRGGKGWHVNGPEAVPADEMWYHAGRYAGGSKTLSPAQITLICAAQADGSWEKTANSIKFNFAKDRKTVRLREALKDLGVNYRESVEPGGTTFFYIGRKTAESTVDWLIELIGREKKFGPWLLDLDRRSLDLFIRELPLWDGRSKSGTEYFSIDATNAGWVQILHAVSGSRARIRQQQYQNPEGNVLYVVNTTRRAVPYSMTTNMQTRRVPYKGTVYCVTVPTRFIVVREGNLVSVTGNCGDAVDDKYNRILQWAEYAPKDSPLAKKKFVTRSVVKARDGWSLVTADLKGAEIAAAGWFSGDELLIEHARRSTLPEDHPDWLDLHSDLAASAFGLDCPLSEVKKKYKPLRVAAKRARFGHYYGASPDTILRQVQQESPDVTLEQIERIVKGHDQKYPVLAHFFAMCRKRVHSPGWLCNGMGGFRRFRKAVDRDLLASQEREAQNWACQGLVADVIAFALGNLWTSFRELDLRSRILISVHDSIVVESPDDELELVADEKTGLLTKAMTVDCPVVITTLDGTPVNRGPYFFGVDTAVYRNWGCS